MLEERGDNPPDTGPGDLPAGEGPERNLGAQPLANRMEAAGWRPADLVRASEEQLTHKMVSRAMLGRRLTARTMDKVLRAWNRLNQAQEQRSDLFNYDP